MLWILRNAGGLESILTLLVFPKRMASSPWGAVRPTPESGLLAKQVSTAQVRSAGGQRHFRPPGARHYAPHCHAGPRGPKAAGLSDCVRCLFASYNLSPESRSRQPRVVFALKQRDCSPNQDILSHLTAACVAAQECGDSDDGCLLLGASYTALRAGAQRHE